MYPSNFEGETAVPLMGKFKGFNFGQCLPQENILSCSAAAFVHLQKRHVRVLSWPNNLLFLVLPNLKGRGSVLVTKLA